MLEIKKERITKLVRGQSIFHSTGISEIKVTRDGEIVCLEIPIRSTGVSELIDAFRDKAPKPPMINKLIEPDSELGKELKITKKNAIKIFDFTNEIYLKEKVRIFLFKYDATRFGDVLVASMQIDIEGFDLAETFILLHLDMGSGKIQTIVVQALFCEHHISAPARRFCDVVLGEAMNQVHIRADEFLDVGDRLANIVTAMDEEFQIKCGDVAAGITGAGGRALHGKLFVTKRNVHGFDKID